MNKTNVKGIAAMTTSPAGGDVDPGVLPAGQADSYIGSIEVGTQAILDALDNVKSIINESVFDIFNNLKALTTNLQSYFAEGLTDDSKAENASTAAHNIEGKTEEIRKT